MTFGRLLGTALALLLSSRESQCKTYKAGPAEALAGTVSAKPCLSCKAAALTLRGGPVYLRPVVAALAAAGVAG